MNRESRSILMLLLALVLSCIASLPAISQEVGAGVGAPRYPLYEGPTLPRTGPVAAPGGVDNPGDRANRLPGNPQRASSAPVAGQGVPNQSPAGAGAPGAPNSKMQLIEIGAIIARIGGEVVTAGDILPRVDEMLARAKGRVTQQQLDEIRPALMARELNQLVDTKLLYVDAKRTIPKENLPEIEKKLEAQFDAVELPRLYEATKTNSRAALDRELNKAGSSLARVQRAFAERTLASQWMREQVKYDVDISHDEMLAYYREHIKDYEFEARAKWEELMVRFDRHPDKGSAYRALANLGNQVFQGAPFADVARGGSNGPTAGRGGANDWTTRGSLVSQELNRAIFTLPVGQLSPIIETEAGFHIVRVTERHSAGRKPFVEAQVEIKLRLEREKRQEQLDEYLARLRRQTRVWTIFDDGIPGLPGQSAQFGARPAPGTRR